MKTNLVFPKLWLNQTSFFFPFSFSRRNFSLLQRSRFFNISPSDRRQSWPDPIQSGAERCGEMEAPGPGSHGSPGSGRKGSYWGCHVTLRDTLKVWVDHVCATWKSPLIFTWVVFGPGYHPQQVDSGACCMFCFLLFWGGGWVGW